MSRWYKEISGSYTELHGEGTELHGVGQRKWLYWIMPIYRLMKT